MFLSSHIFCAGISGLSGYRWLHDNHRCGRKHVLLACRSIICPIKSAEKAREEQRSRPTAGAMEMETGNENEIFRKRRVEDKIEADSEMIDGVNEETKEKRRSKKRFGYIVTVKVTTSDPSPPLTRLSQNDLDSVDILQLVLTQNMRVSSAPETHAYRPHSMSEVRGPQVGMQHHGSEHNEVITLCPQSWWVMSLWSCKIVGSSLQSSRLFWWHSLSRS